MWKIVCLALALQVVYSAKIVKRAADEDAGYYVVCKQAPVDLGIVLDSSSSIRGADFKKGLKFLQDFIGEFDIGTGRNDVRVSIIPFGYGIYTNLAFNLDTYTTAKGVIDAIGNIKHKFGLRTDTGAAIEYMHDVQMNPKVTRDYAEKVAVVLTDGNSQEGAYTASAAAAARADGIKVIAVGVGNVKESELLNIAGKQENVIKVRSYSELEGVIKRLAKETCIRKPIPTTTPAPLTMCGQARPSDIEFVFSPSDMGLEGTFWATNFMSLVIDNKDMTEGFRFGVISGLCPDDAGFDLDRYDNALDVKDRLREYETYKMPKLISRVSGAFSEDKGGRADASNIAILILTEETDPEFEEEVERLLDENVQVFIADPYGIGFDFPGVTVLEGEGALEVSQSFVSAHCG